MTAADDSLHWIGDETPDLDGPVMVVMLTGWIDASGAAAAAMETITDECDATPVATFDDDTYIDFRARRPVMELREGLNSVLRWNHTTVSTARDRTGRDLVLLSGPEPDMAWHRFAHRTARLATDLGVTMMVALGAYPFTTPHTRPSKVSLSTPSQDVLSRLTFLRSSIDVPAGMASVLEHSLHDAGIPTVGLWAQVPHYIASLEYPAAGVALIDSLRDAADVVIDGTDLRQAAVSQRERLDELVSGNEEHQHMLRQLEQLHDAADDTPGGGGPAGPGLPMASGDEIAAELERFLRDQD
ncbi:MAG: PAC2 family protein [Ilumatobacteraceae bacterium]